MFDVGREKVRKIPSASLSRRALFVGLNISGVINYWEEIDLPAMAPLTESRLKFHHPSYSWRYVIYAKSRGFKTRESTFNLYNLLRIPQSIIMTNFFRWLRCYGFECEFRHTFTSKTSSKLHKAPWRGISFYFATCASLRFHLLWDASRDPWSVVRASPLFHYCSRGMLAR